MKLLLQRVHHAKITTQGKTTTRITTGLVLLTGFGKNDTTPPLTQAAEKIVNLRIFPNKSGKLDHSLLDISGEILAVPQFTLYGQTHRGRRPDFTQALPPTLAEEHFHNFIKALKQTPVSAVKSGHFGANMTVSLANHGPFTLMLEW